MPNSSRVIGVLSSCEMPWIMSRCCTTQASMRDAMSLNWRVNG
ncbi:hypothetical protein [Cupriavidus basilensis]|nr:hypothetical protein [Cupriavidus basilensis]